MKVTAAQGLLIVLLLIAATPAIAMTTNMVMNGDGSSQVCTTVCNEEGYMCNTDCF